MEQGLGRLGFAANALTWERPFLGPLYSWTAAIRNKTGVLRIPTMLRTILWFLADRTAEGGSLQAPPPFEKRQGGQYNFLYRCESDGERGLWVGGFLQTSDGQIGEWFSEEVEEAWAPWLFLRKDPKRVIAALEMLATLIAVRTMGKGLADWRKRNLLGKGEHRQPLQCLCG